jgi:hypothetical protein
LTLDSKPPSQPFATYAREETRYQLLTSAGGEALSHEVDLDIAARWRLIQALAGAAEPALDRVGQ